MTDTIATDRADSGEIPRLIGEDRTVILRRDTTGEATQNIGPWSEFSHPVRRPGHDDTMEMRIVEPPLGLSPDDLQGPQNPPPPPPVPLPPLRPAIPPKPRYDDMAAAQPIAPWERVAGAADTEVVSLLGALGGVPVASMVVRPRRSLWARMTYKGKHRAVKA